MAKALRILGIAIVLALLPAAAIALKKSYDFDKSANFTSFKTFAMKEGIKSGDPFVDKRVAEAVQAAFAARGMARNESNPDLFVVPHLTFEKEKDFTAFSDGYGPYGWWWGGGWGVTEIRVKEITMGTLVIDVADAATKELVWRGIGVGEIDPLAKPQVRDRRIVEAATKILKNYPPKRAT